MENAMRSGHGDGGVGAEQQFASASIQVGFSQDDERSGGGMGQRSFVDVFFHCSQYWAWCCGVDCCQLDPALVFTGACVLVVLCTLFVHCCLHSQLGKRVCVRRLFRMHRLRHKRVIARTNAQRRKSTVDDTEIARGDVGVSRKPSKTVSSGDAEQYRHQQQKQQRRSGGNLRRMLRNSIRETIGRGHRRLVRTGHQFRGDLLKNTRSVPEIVVTEPSSSCFEGEDVEEGRGESMRR
uniref:Transmembrane protein n=1 Tax=Globodera pallida TaxID=36090 RepID=A0A183BMM5_GLOPA